jgi:hypothetical protein
MPPVDLSHCYFRAADLPGIDFSNAASKARVSTEHGFPAPFSPAELTADEVMLSANHGTRMRYKK